MSTINIINLIKDKQNTIFLVFFMTVFFTGILYAQENIKTASIKTSAQCDMCKSRIEKHLSKQDGIIESDLHIETAICSVKYDSTKISPDDIRLEISKVGYDADDIKANKRAYEKLPKCCKKPEDR